jgi:hypothetical protein
MSLKTGFEKRPVVLLAALCLASSAVAVLIRAEGAAARAPFTAAQYEQSILKDIDQRRINRLDVTQKEIEIGIKAAELCEKRDPAKVAEIAKLLYEIDQLNKAYDRELLDLNRQWAGLATYHRRAYNAFVKDPRLINSQKAAQAAARKAQEANTGRTCHKNTVVLSGSVTDTVSTPSFTDGSGTTWSAWKLSITLSNLKYVHRARTAKNVYYLSGGSVSFTAGKLTAQDPGCPPLIYTLSNVTLNRPPFGMLVFLNRQRTKITFYAAATGLANAPEVSNGECSEGPAASGAGGEVGASGTISPNGTIKLEPTYFSTGAPGFTFQTPNEAIVPVKVSGNLRIT